MRWIDNGSKLGMAVMVAGAVTAGLGHGPVEAAIITQNISQPADVNGWNVASIWTPSGAPTAGNDYVNPATFTLRTPEANNTTFAGDSLSVSGLLAMKSANNSSRTKIVNDLIMNGGATISNFTDGSGQTQTLNGGLTVAGSYLVTNTTAGQARNMSFGATISGGTGATVSHTAANSSTLFTYSNAANTFDGTWGVSSGILRFSAEGAVGTGDILVQGGQLQVQYNWDDLGALSVTGGTVVMSTFNFTLGSLMINGSPVADGTYTVSDLNTIAGATRFTGTGTVTVVPEPAALSLLALAGASVGAGVRRRCRG